MNYFLIAFLLLIVLSSTSFAKKKNGETFLVWPSLGGKSSDETSPDSELDSDLKMNVVMGCLGLSKYPHYDWNS